MKENKLFYNKPARKWTEALPLGNGHIGAMIYGNPVAESICLNDDTLWTGHPADTDVHDTEAYMRQVHQALADGDNLKAQEIIETHMLGQEGDAYLPLGNLRFDFPGHESAAEYRRELDLSTGVCTVSYRCGDTIFLREHFISAVHDAFCIRFTSCGSQKLNFYISLESQLKNKCFTEQGLLILDGECPSNNEMEYETADEKRGVCFRAAVKVTAENGTVIAADGKISVKDADVALLYFTVKTSFNGFDKLPVLEGKEYKSACLDAIAKLPELGEYEQVKALHIRDFKEYYDRVSFSLGEDEKAEQALATDERLTRFQQAKSDLGLYELLFNFGRYLLISASRAGTQPANLQGIWNKELKAPWKSNYTLNINLEMNYWPALVCSMPELHQPLLQLIEDLVTTGRKTAQRMYGARGFTAHHNTDLWRKTSPVCGRSNHAFWNMAPAWLCLHLFEHYQYTQDLEFLRQRAYPVMKEAALFCLDLLSENREGQLRISPSTSPENFFLVNKTMCAVADSATMTTSLVRCLFSDCITAARLLDDDADFRTQLETILTKLEPYRISCDGRLLEWDQDFEENEIHHRHLSHLYGLFPGHDLVDMKNEDLLKACKNTMDVRGDEGSGWCTSWKICLRARLLDGEHALRLLKQQLRPVLSDDIDYTGGGGTYPNLFDAHPPFQIDGNFGVAAGMAELLMQSYDGAIHILPALPSEWSRGEIHGLTARGNVRVDIRWENNTAQSITLISPVAKKVTVRYRGQETEADLEANAPLKIKF